MYEIQQTLDMFFITSRHALVEDVDLRFCLPSFMITSNLTLDGTYIFSSPFHMSFLHIGWQNIVSSPHSSCHND